MSKEIIVREAFVVMCSTDEKIGTTICWTKEEAEIVKELLEKLM